jgi:cytoskeletal protein RodZ
LTKANSALKFIKGAVLMASSIGIKIANGEFYPLIEENSSVRKRMILTTVHDKQPSVQIDLYRSSAKIMTDAQYIGSLVVENIRPKPKGEPSIEMVISSKSNGEIVAEAIDLDTSSKSEHYMLTVSLKSVDETSRDAEIPDFELESNEEPPSSLYNHAERIRKKERRKSAVWLFILIFLIVILALLGTWLFFFDGLNTVQSKWPVAGQALQEKVVEPVKQFGNSVNQMIPRKTSNRTARPAVVSVSEPAPVKAAEPAPVKVAEPVPAPVKAAEPVPVKVAEPAPVKAAEPAPVPAARPQIAQNLSRAPVLNYNVPAVIPREGVNYVVRWGDTLWDISYAFYRDPWLYPRIARHNNIRNPNYIISGRVIRIPPKN